jgi:uncharacterized protein (TIRG00374 family)
VTKGRLLFWLLIAAFLWLLVSRMGEIEKTAEPLVRGQIDWILAAAILQVLYYAVFACMFKSAFYTVGVESRIRDLLPVTFGALFVNVVAPTWGMAGAALYIDDAAHRGESPARAAAGTLLAQTADFTSFALILGGGVAYLLIRHRLRGYEIAGTLVLLAILCSLALSLILALWRPVILKRMMFSAQNIINSIMLRIRRPAILSDGWAEKNASDFSMAAGAIKDRPKWLVLTVLIALFAHVINIASLYSLFIAFNQHIGAAPLVAGYAMGILFWNISPVPQGIGVVEGVMTLVYASLGIHRVNAALIVLAFRGLNFWLPMLAGFFLIRKVRLFGPTGKA